MTTERTIITDQILNFRFGGLDQGTEHRRVQEHGGDETCEVVSNDDRTYSVKTPNGEQWLSIQPDGSFGWRSVSDPTQPGPWEKFYRDGNVLIEQPKDGMIRAAVELLIGSAGLAETPRRTLLSPIHGDGIDLKTDDGQRYVHNQATNYLLFQRFARGEDIAPLLYDGFDGYNVTFLMSIVPKQAGLPDLTPKNDPQFFNKAGDFLASMHTAQKRIEGTLICDNNIFGYDEPWLFHYCEQMYELFRAFPINLVQLANEPEKNGIDCRNFAQPSGLMWSRGSSLSGQQCPLPPGSYSTAHLARQGGGAWLDAQSYYMVNGYAGYAGVHGPCIVNETRGASNDQNSDSRTTDPNYFRKIAGAAREWGGMTFHSNYGIHSEPFQANTPQDECRKAFLEGIGATV